MSYSSYIFHLVPHPPYPLRLIKPRFYSAGSDTFFTDCQIFNIRNICNQDKLLLGETNQPPLSFWFSFVCIIPNILVLFRIKPFREFFDRVFLKEFMFLTDWERTVPGKIIINMSTNVFRHITRHLMGGLIVIHSSAASVIYSSAARDIDGFSWGGSGMIWSVAE